LVDTSLEDVERHNRYYARALDLMRNEILLHGQPRTPHPGWFARRRLRHGIRLLEAALALNPTSWQNRFWIGKAHQRLGEQEEAARWLMDAHRLAPDEPWPANEAGIAALELGQVKVAISLLRRFAAVGSNHSASEYNLGLALLLDQQPQVAREVLVAAARVSGGSLAENLLMIVDDVIAGRCTCPSSLAQVRQLLPRR